MSEPSFSNGFASPWYGGRMKYPGLWRGCVGAWSPLLGPTGATLFDQSGRCNHGTLTNMDPATDWVVDRYGHTLDFDGSNDYTSLSKGGGIDGATTGSIAMWVRWMGTAASGLRKASVCGRQKNGTWSQHIISLAVSADPAVGTIQYEHQYSINGWIVSSIVPGLATWRHIVITWSGANGELFIDGRSAGTSSSFPAVQSDISIPFDIGGWTGDGGSYTPCQFSNVATWTRILSPNEITLLAQRPGIMYELEDSDVWGAVEAGGSVPWWAFANRQSRIIGGGVT